MPRFGSVGCQVVFMAERKKDPWSELSGQGQEEGD